MSKFVLQGLSSYGRILRLGRNHPLLCQTPYRPSHITPCILQEDKLFSSDSQGMSDEFGTLDANKVKIVYNRHKRYAKKTRRRQRKKEQEGRVMDDEVVTGDGVKIKGHNYLKTKNVMDELSKEQHDVLETPKEAPAESDSFGALADELDRITDFENPIRYADDIGEEDESEKPYRRLSEVGRKNTPVWYGNQIKKLGKDGRVKEAIAVLEVQMLKEDRVMPTPYVFNVLIGVLGRAGYTAKAFQLFNKMKKFGLEPENPTYTSLFNACSNSPWKEDGLKRAKHLYNLMHDKEYQPNLRTYKAMIKAFGKCGDIETAFSLVDEIIESGDKLDDEVFSHLLVACCSDSNAGFRHAISVWRRMSKRRIKPTVFHYNLLLRATKHCRIGDPSLFENLILLEGGEGNSGVNESTDILKIKSPLSLSEEKNILQTAHVDNSQISSSSESQHLENGGRDESVAAEVIPSLNQPKGEDTLSVLPRKTGIRQYEPTLSPPSRGSSIFNMEVPDILYHKQKRAWNIVALGAMDLPHQRLSLIGGLPGFFRHMTQDDVKPNIKTFSQLLDVIVNTAEAETDLLNLMRIHEVKPDLDFFNLLIRKKTKRGDLEGAKSVLVEISARNLTPNLYTFGCMAPGCYSRDDGLQLIGDMESAGFVPNVDIFGMLLRRSGHDVIYKSKLCRKMEELNISPDEPFLEQMEVFLDDTIKQIVQKERGEEVADFYNNPKFAKRFGQFRGFYRAWLLRVDCALPAHPWDKYRDIDQQKN